MKLYLLDKNIVEDIHDSLRGGHSSHIALARAIDRKRCTVSPILAILEGSYRKPQTINEMHASIERDTDAVRRFYRLAHTDAGWLQAGAVEMALTMTAHWRKKIEAIVPLAERLQALLVNTKSIADARSLREQIEALSNTYSVGRAHPLIVSALACLYGHVAARKVLKPTQNPSNASAYNAAADIRLLLESAYIRHLYRNALPMGNVVLHTRDKHLNALAKALSVEVGTKTLRDRLDPETVPFEATISESLFPNLLKNPKEMQRVLSYFRENKN